MRLPGWKLVSGGDRNMQNLRDLHNQNKLHITFIIHYILLIAPGMRMWIFVRLRSL